MNSQVRCAIYTRKSSEEGLEQSFNSLHAQREACEAYVASQRHEGWLALKTAYDDGGFSGGSTNRPGLKQLLADITAGKVDTVVVYKVDRLTRSLADFAKIIELFDSKQVSFVSVTQQFNTTTSMGRLTLNVLLSFAQFEREVTGERIRDKIAASKAKGMWMGGPVPLGYDVRDRKLSINSDEAETIREVFREYLRIGSVSGLKEYLDHRPTFSKARILKGDRLSGGGKFVRGGLYRLLNNHLYIGEVSHKDKVHKGQHEAIIEREQWLEVQQLLAENRQGPKSRKRKTKSSLLMGILFDEHGNKFTPTHANKAGKRYRYYTSQTIIRRAGSHTSMLRIPADDLDQAVLGRIERFLNSDEDLLALAQKLALLGRELQLFFQAAREAAEKWSQFSTSEREAFANQALLNVIVLHHTVEINLALSTVLDWRPKLTPLDESNSAPDTRSEVVNLSCPFTQVRRGSELKLVIDGDEPLLSNNSSALHKSIARARLWYEQIVAGEVGSLREIAKREGITPRFVNRTIRCALLGPEGVEAILSGKCSPALTIDHLVNSVPIEWIRQRRLLTIDHS